MFLILGIILALAWLCGFLLFHVASAGIHILIALAVISVIVHFVRSGASRGS